MGFTLLELSLVIGVFALILFTARPFFTYVMYDGSRDAADLLVEAKHILDTHAVLLRQNNALELISSENLNLKTPDDLSISLGPGAFDADSQTYEFLHIGGLGNSQVLSSTIAEDDGGASHIRYIGYDSLFEENVSTDSVDAINVAFGHSIDSTTISFETTFYWGNNNDTIFSP